MTSFLKWAENVLDKVDEKATDKVKDFRGDKTTEERGVRRSFSEDRTRPSDHPTPPRTPLASSLPIGEEVDTLALPLDSTATSASDATTTAPIADTTSPTASLSASDLPVILVEASPNPPVEPSLSPVVKKPEALVTFPISIPLLKKKVSARNVTVPSERVTELEAEVTQLKAKLQETTIEAGGLRTVWQETRDALSRAKKLLIQKDDQYKKVLKEKEAEAQHDIDNLHAHYAEQIKELKRTIAQNQLEFGSALSAKDGHREDQEKGIDEMRQQRDEALAKGERLQAEIARLEDLRDELMQSKQELIAQHKRVLTSLREEQAAKDLALEQQKQFHESSLKNFQTRASSLEQDTAEYVNAVATAQREVEEKSRELSRVLTESRWVKADQQALRDEISSLQAQLEAEKVQRAAIEANWLQKVEQLNARLEQANKANASASALRARDEVVFKQMEIDLATERANPCKQQVVELQARLTNITEHFTTQIESLTSERATLRLLLEDEKARTALLQAQLATAKVRTLEDEDIDEDTDPLLMEQGSRIKRRGKLELSLLRKEFQSPAVKGAIGFLDGFGTYIGVTLRRNPAARLLFALYILLLHLWVVVVLYLTFHSATGQVNLDPPRVNGHNS